MYHYALILYHLTTVRGLGSGARSVSENSDTKFEFAVQDAIKTPQAKARLSRDTFAMKLVATGIELGLWSKARNVVQNFFCLFHAFQEVVPRVVPEQVPEQVQDELVVVHGRHGARVARPQRNKRRGQAVWKRPCRPQRQPCTRNCTFCSSTASASMVTCPGRTPSS